MKKIRQQKKPKKAKNPTGLFRNIATKIIPKKLSGDASAITKLLSSAYSNFDSTLQVNEVRGKNAEQFMLIIIAIVLSIVFIISNIFTDKSIGDIKRDRYGGDTKVIESDITAQFNDETVKKRVQVKIRPEGANTTEIAKRMEDLKFNLPDMIMGENESLDAVTNDLNLIKRDNESGIEISWKSSNESLIDSDGKLNLIDAEKGDFVMLTAYLRLGQASDDFNMQITLDEPNFSKNTSEKIELSLEKLIESISKEQAGEKVTLPKSTGSGIKLSWATPDNTIYYFIPFFIILLGYYLYKKRYAGIDKKIKDDRESVGRDFPDFLSKLLLLLNAGMVISSALAKIADDYEMRKRKGEERYFYEELCEMQSRIRNSNTTLSAEFSELALKTGRREVMRFSAILLDNIDKGSALAEKLAQESEMLWTMRKKTAEEKGRLAETKLTFPMVLQLLVIILITIAPTSLGMN